MSVCRYCNAEEGLDPHPKECPRTPKTDLYGRGPAVDMINRMKAEQKSEAQKRKEAPMAEGCLDYFPDALEAVARLSYIGNEQHNPGTELHWDRSKSGDEASACLRHLKDRKRNPIDTDGVPHVVKVAWRGLALAQKWLEDNPWN